MANRGDYSSRDGWYHPCGRSSCGLSLCLLLESFKQVTRINANDELTSWSNIVSATFQFIGFMVTYLLHTSHAGKNGSRAGLGLSLIQFGLYVRSRKYNPRPSLVIILWTKDRTHLPMSLFVDGSLDDFDDGNGDDSNGQQDPNLNADVVAYFLMVIGWFIIVRSVADYLKAKHMEKIISTDPLALITRSMDNAV